MRVQVRATSLKQTRWRQSETIQPEHYYTLYFIVKWLRTFFQINSLE
jgi:hypothetical protein